MNYLSFRLLKSKKLILLDRINRSLILINNKTDFNKICLIILLCVLHLSPLFIWWILNLDNSPNNINLINITARVDLNKTTDNLIDNLIIIRTDLISSNQINKWDPLFRINPFKAKKLINSPLNNKSSPLSNKSKTS